MSYTTPVTDRTSADLVARNSKAFVNVADWTRIYENSRLVHDLVAIQAGAVVFNTLSTPIITSIPTITDVNTLTGNIELTRTAFVDEIDDSIPGTQIPIKDDYEAGASKPIFNYKDVNKWESTLDAIWEFLDGPDIEVCPTLTGNLTVLTGVVKIYIDCLDTGGFDIDIQGTGALYII